MLDMLITGAVTGALSTLASVLILKKVPHKFYMLAIKNMLVTDILFGWAAIAWLPVVGLTTLVSATVYMVIFSLFLNMEHKRLIGPIKH